MILPYSKTDCAFVLQRFNDMYDSFHSFSTVRLISCASSALLDNKRGNTEIRQVRQIINLNAPFVS